MASAFHLKSLRILIIIKLAPSNKGQKVLTTKHGVTNVL